MENNNHIDNEEILREIQAANEAVGGATTAFNAVMKKLAKLQKSLDDYKRYFKIAVAIGVVAMLLAAGAIAGGYYDRIEIREIQVKHVYDACLADNQSKENTLHLITEVNEKLISNPASQEEITIFIEGLRDDYGFRDCEPLKP